MSVAELAREARRVLDFWFGPAPGQKRDVWFRKDAVFDSLIRDRFLDLHGRAAAGKCDAMAADAKGSLALIVVLDQFSRNLYRDSPQAFACDGRALGLARQALARGFDRGLPDVERVFLYLPFEHAEDAAVQAESVALFATVPDERTQRFARRHQEIVERFGRFPHRNAALGRVSTEEELAFLREPESSF